MSDIEKTILPWQVKSILSTKTYLFIVYLFQLHIEIKSTSRVFLQKKKIGYFIRVDIVKMSIHLMAIILISRAHELRGYSLYQPNGKYRRLQMSMQQTTLIPLGKVDCLERPFQGKLPVLLVHLS